MWAGPRDLYFAGRRSSLAEAKLPVSCEVGSKTGSPCHRRAVVEMRGVAFCGRCAREQEAYFVIGELTQEDETQGSGGKVLVAALARLRRERAGGTEGTAAGTHHRSSGVDETEPLALTHG
jgi:hypothetical protein